ncbi:MAG TPA: GxxExxY protein [Candidatus Cloacimonadota bacterium]|nr:GxxExxY protein [Candidatus Cloacimonadota bacterium]
MQTEVNKLCAQIIGAAIEVHKHMGPGLLEKVYLKCLCSELDSLRLSYTVEQAIPLVYKGTPLDMGFRADLIVENKVIVELKSVTEMNPLFDAQLISYLTLSGLPTGLLINFNVGLLKDGIKRLFPKMID